MSAPTTATLWHQPPEPTEPAGNVHDGELESGPRVVIQEKVVYMVRPRPMWRVVLETICYAATGVMVLSGITVAWNASSASSYSSYDKPSFYSPDDPLPTRSAPGITCNNGYVKDGKHQCVDEAVYEEVKAKATKQFKATMRDGEADFTRWVEKKGLKPALSSSRSAITLSYLCSVKPTQNGRLYAANSLGVKDSIDTFFADNNVMVAVGWNSATEIAQEWCPTVPSWAKPSPPKPSAPPSLAPQPSAPAPGENIKPAPDEAGYGG